MRDYAQSGRNDHYTAFLVDPFTLNETGETIQLQDGSSSLTWNLYGDNILSGSLSMLNSTNNKKLVRIKHTMTFPDGETETETLGTLFINNTGFNAKYKLITRNLDCYSTYWRFTQDSTMMDFFRPEGYNVVQAIRDIVEVDGGLLRVMPGVDVDRCFGNDIWFERKTVRSTVINTMAGWINAEVTIDPDGYIVLQPYVTPNQKPIKYTFESGYNCTYISVLDYEENLDGCYNRCVVAWSTSESSNVIFEDLPASDPYSYESIGRKVTNYIDLTEETSEEDMRAMALDFLDRNHTSIEYVEIEAVYNPALKVGNVVRYINDTDYPTVVSLKCMITQIDMTLGNGCMCKIKMKVVS